MKRNQLITLLLSALFLSGTGAFAGTHGSLGTADNFNSRSGISLSGVKGYLQGNCWFFADFDINRSGWSPNLEGDGAMVSGTGASPTEMTGIYTPLLDVDGAVAVSFKYKFNLPVADRRWIKIYAADANDRPSILLDSLELTGSDNITAYSYNRTLTTPSPGLYKLYINYQGMGGSERIAIDQLSIGAPAHYQSTCNAAPVAIADKFEGDDQRNASGNVLHNDYDPNHEELTAYLLSDSPDGSVTLNANGEFSFRPKPGFSGNATHFTYKVCDNGYPSLCSLTATATIGFPAKPAPAGALASSLSGLSGLNALYKKNEVDINWNIAPGNKSEHFEIERSLDGLKFEKMGEVKSTGIKAPGEDYLFTDRVHESLARRNDLYYRLRMVDANNKASYSRVLIVRMYGSRSVTAVSVTPDPTVNDIQINVQLKENSFVVMRMTDNNGSEIMKKSARGGLGVNNYNLDGTSRMQPGMYKLEVIINSNERMIMQLAKS